jgi:metal-responsive CopG/Arc/MetJ family transcriptional regulator
MDVSSTETYSEITQIPKHIMGNMIIVIPTDPNILKKLNRVEIKYQDQIVSKNQRYHNDQNIIFMVFEGLLQEFQKMVVEINSIKEIKNFRYLIVN